MACSNWEESALLYCSNELSQEMATTFKSHIEECESCRTFYEQYKKESATLFSVEVLGELPSESVDKELLRVCANSKKQYTNVGLFSSVAKKTFISVSLFLIGFIVVGYFMMNVHQVRLKQESFARENNLLNSSPTTPSVIMANSNKGIDNQKDSIISSPDSNQYFSKKRGNLDLNGVIPVDLLNK